MRYKVVLESIINFLEMLTSCFFAAQIFKKKFNRKIDILQLLLFTVLGTLLLTLRETEVLIMPDYVPSLVTFSLYAITMCHAKLWLSVSWALLNYLLIGIVSLSFSAVFNIILNIPKEVIELQIDKWFPKRVFVRVGQLMFSEIIIKIMRKFQKEDQSSKGTGWLIGSSVISIIVLMGVWKLNDTLTEDILLLATIVICILILIINFSQLFFREIILKERDEKETLRIQNQMISMQIRSQNDVSEMYENMRSLKHDLNTHLHTIWGYMQMKEYRKAEDYMQRMIGEISTIEAYHSGNNTLDALLGSKSALARNRNIKVDVELDIGEPLLITDEHLVIIIGNLYDNAMEANEKIEDIKRRYIAIQIFSRHNNLVLTFENAVKEEKRNNKKFWHTNKEDKQAHGYGLRNIERIVQLYNGYYERELNEHIFTCSIRLSNIKIEKML